MDKEQIMKTIQNIIEAIKDAFNRIKRAVLDLFDRVDQLNDKKDRPKNVTNVHDYLENKKKSETFYKSVNGQRKPWE